MSSSDEKRSPPSGQPVTASGKVGEQNAHPMATMHDDDERLLAQIGYEQVGYSLVYESVDWSPNNVIEICPPFYQVFHALLCRLCPGSPGLGPGDFW